ncbi:hypothetical protein EJB10_01610 [Wolbachia endosymbiont of Brugia malayi]|uniref:hypothetical protein n=1 Tax=Wolbachia endosymbiont of Brugia malayi TaxID=80849 RepID=UPI00004C94FB|nr:hypothetical protein [Wolbachia endosymbiont of Brugia malayi]AAW71340.1 Predicted protein WF-3 [Wolbachia endosymbiont strain TRS of Brugia malayi]QCB61529.1 hypothetical protein EJB10_01610 [Wolbachia endosymbiont of Brugia malayi]
MDDNVAIVFNLTGNNPYNSFDNSTKNSRALEGVKCYSASKTEELCKVIKKRVTKKDYRENQESGQDKTPRKCKKLFKKGASPEVLTKLGELLIEQEKYYNNYIQHFLPALKREIIKSKELNLIEKIKIEQIIMKLITSDAVSKNSNESHSNAETNEQSANGADNTLSCTAENSESGNTCEETSLKCWRSLPNLRDNSQFNFGEKLLTKMDTLEPETNASELNNGSGGDSGVSLPGLSEDGLESPLGSERSNVSSILSSAEEDNNLQKEENENQMKLDQTAREELQVQENKNQVSKVSPVQPPKKKKNVEDITMQKLPMNEKKGENILPKEQLSNREFYGIFTTGCALLAIGCFVGAVVIKSRALFLGLSVIAVVFATAAVAVWYLTLPPSSKLMYTNSSPVINNERSLLHV